MNTLWLIPFIPILTSVVIRLLGRSVLPRKAVETLACSSIAASFVFTLFGLSDLKNSGSSFIVNHLFTWIKVGDLNIAAGFYLDALSGIMCLLVTFVGFLIHLYSIGYMHEDKSYERYFSYLNLFTGMMLILILGESLLLMFVGWEGVGLCSYLLIGFWFGKNENANAAKKAFIVNRVGDFGVLIGMFVLLWGIGGQTGQWSLDFSFIKENLSALSGVSYFGISAITLATMALFLGATGKSAQIPLYVWLPDAMAGPTPVSALIHAATMVTSGIYMICRLSFLFDAAPVTLEVIAIVGAATAFMAATIALVQNDIKKVLAYSTVSQLGYMFLACGVGAYASGLFHVLTHAFFKALLFLGAGSVIHAMGGEQDMRKMGGLRTYTPITFLTFLIACIAIAGVPPFSGFFSKDEILWQVWNHSKVLWAVGALTAFLTAFYMFRLLFMTFWGQCRSGEEVISHIHESPRSMTVPLAVLAFLSIFAGFLWLPGYLSHHPTFPSWLEGVVVIHHPNGSHATEILLTLGSVLIALGGILMAKSWYAKPSHVPNMIAARFSAVQRVLQGKYFVDELYDSTVVRGTLSLAKLLAWFDRVVVDGVVHLAARVVRFCSVIDGWFDRVIVDGLVNGVGYVARWSGRNLRKIQTGQIQTYISVLSVGVFIVYLIWWYSLSNY